MRGNGPTTEESPPDVYGHEPIPLLETYLLERFHLDSREDRGIVDEHVYAAEFLHGPVHHRPYALGVGHVGPYRRSFAAQRTHLRGHPLRFAFLYVGHHDARPFSGEP